MPSLLQAIRQIKNFPIEHLRVVGLPGSGKTRLLIERYKFLKERGTSVFIVTFSREELKRITAAIVDDSGEGLPPVLTYFTLAREVIAGAGRQPPRLVSDLEERMLVRAAIDDSAPDLKSDYRKIRDSESLQREILDAFHLLLQHDIKGSRVDRLKSVARSDRLVDTLLLYRRYLEALDARGYTTYADISRTAANACADLAKTHPLREAGVLLVDDFQDVDAGQFELLTRLAPPVGDTALNVFGDPMGAYFGFRGTQSRFLMDVFPELYASDTLTVTGPSLNDALLRDTLGALASEVLGDEVAAFHMSGPTADIGPLFAAATDNDENQGGGEVVMTTATDEVEEIYGAASCVRQWITSGVCNPDEIAVITNDRRRYEPMLRAAFAQHGVPLDTGRPTQDVFRNFIKSLLVLLVARDDNVAQQALVTSPFYPYFHAMLSPAPMTPDQAQEAKNLIRWLSASQLPMAPGELIEHIVRKWLRPACDRYEKQTGDDTVFTFLSLLIRRWDEYASAVQAVGRTPRVREFVRASTLFGLQRTTPMPFAEEVGLYTCREVKGRFFKCVVLLGCSELLFPSAQRREALIPAAALQQVCDEALPELSVGVYSARSPLAHLHEEYHLMYLSVTRALDRLHVSAPKTFAGQSHPAPATILAGTLPESVYREWSADSITPPQIQFAREWVRQVETPEIAARLNSLSPFGQLWNLAQPEPRDFEIARFPLSKSSLESYLRCPRQFFYEKILRIRQEGSDALFVGSLFHDVMAKINQRFPSKRELVDNITDAIIADTIEEAIDDTSAPGQPVDPASLYGMSLRFYLSSMIRSALGHERKDSDDYTVAGTETPFEFDYQGQGFRGRFDRVDTTSGGGAVMDYKTGGFDKMAVTLRKKTLYALDKPDKANWQLPMYVWGFRDQTGELPDAFRHLVQAAGGDPFSVTLYIRRRERDVPREALSTKRDYKAFSYLLETEIEDIMNAAVAQAETMFAARARFDKTDNVNHCGNCMFNRVCDRRTD